MRERLMETPRESESASFLSDRREAERRRKKIQEARARTDKWGRRRHNPSGTENDLNSMVPKVGETRTVLILMRYNMAKLDQRRRVGKNDFKP